MAKSKYSKVQRAYRHDPDVAAFIKLAAPLCKMSAAQFVDACIIRQGRAVVKDQAILRKILRDKTTAQALAALLKKH